MMREGITVEKDGKTIINWKLCQKFTHGLRLGLSFTEAAENLGLNPQTVRNWHERGSSDEAHNLGTPHALFFREVCKAKPAAKLKRHAQIGAAADKGDWRAAEKLTGIIGDSMENVSEQIQRQMTDHQKARLALSHPTLGPIFRSLVLDDLRQEHGLPTEMERLLFPNPDTFVEATVDDDEEKV